MSEVELVKHDMKSWCLTQRIAVNLKRDKVTQVCAHEDLAYCSTYSKVYCINLTSGVLSLIGNSAT